MPNLKWKIAIVGRRTFYDYSKLESEVLSFFNDSVENFKSDCIEIISGGARGTDTLAIQLARKYNVPYTIFPPEPKDETKQEFIKAAMVRNYKIIERADYVFLFWDMKKVGGTWHDLKYCVELDKPYKIIKIETLI